MRRTFRLDAASDIAAISTVFVAIGAYGCYLIGGLIRRHQPEDFLKSEETQKSKERAGLRSVLYQASQLRMTETEVLKAGFKSRKIKSVAGFDKATGRADVILFEYDRKSTKRKPRRS
jgi:hypothetical protein